MKIPAIHCLLSRQRDPVSVPVPSGERSIGAKPHHLGSAPYYFIAKGVLHGIG